MQRPLLTLRLLVNTDRLRTVECVSIYAWMRILYACVCKRVLLSIGTHVEECKLLRRAGVNLADLSQHDKNCKIAIYGGRVKEFYI